MNVTETVREPGRFSYLVRGRGRATWLVVRHLGNDDLCLHWISTSCKKTANPEIALRLAMGTRIRGKRARPGRAEVTIAEIRRGSLNHDDFPKNVIAVLRDGLSNHELLKLISESDRPVPAWATEPKPLWQETDEDYIAR
jgi:hypothetical protein